MNTGTITIIEAAIPKIKFFRSTLDLLIKIQSKIGNIKSPELYLVKKANIVKGNAK